ncbi:hypothetical protein CU097_005679 [Rhizopus azygosporus]|uniref:Uncharacterized protein n=1 Tax=Rhizopus azygosporus TaxID=86630 RepID=A0A367J490_RHIAZ|nr:hypothetical protein CU097_005679 [Rhizopus azygosporus]
MDYNSSICVAHLEDDFYNDRFSSRTNSSNYNSAPLTKENLLKFNKEAKSTRNEILSRYCREASISSSVRERCQSTPTSSHPDIVLASPRLLPFPYHNDSHFLPTAERLQYNLANSYSISSSSSSYRAETSSIPSTIQNISRPQSRSNLKNCCHLSSSIASTHTRKPSSMPYLYSSSSSIRRHSSIVKDDASSSNYRSLSATCSITTSPIHKESYSDRKQIPWIKRLLKFLNKNKLKPHRNREDLERCKSKSNQVWFCKFAVNPNIAAENRQQILATM